MKNGFLLIIFLIIIGCARNNEEQSRENIDFVDTVDYEISTYNYDSYYCVKEIPFRLTTEDSQIMLTGKARVLVKILKFDDKIKLVIRKDTWPFGTEEITTETMAERVGEKYEFQFIDDWYNKAFGNILFNEDETITFYLDCYEYSDIGRSIKGLYGDTYILQKGTIEFVKVKWEASGPCF
jgi:hypothetical protein